MLGEEIMTAEVSCRHCGITVEPSHVVCPICGGFTGSVGVSGRTLAKIAITVVEPIAIWVLMVRVFG
jgi:uncharacterized OB-fold protein